MKQTILLLLILVTGLIKIPTAYASTYDSYINALPSPATITTANQPTVNKLVNEINKMDTDGDGALNHLAPALFIQGTDSFGAIYWGTPGELIGTLAGAYPYLPTALQTKVKTYLDSEIASFNPLTVGFYPPNAGSLSQQSGTKREFFPIDNTKNINFWPGPSVNISVAYPLWQYTYYTGDRRFVDNTSNWNSLVNLYNSAKTSGLTTYSQITGITGFARLAKLKGDTTLTNDATNLANNTMANTSFNTFSGNADAKLRLYLQTFPVFMDGLPSSCCNNFFIGSFAPEIGQFLRDNSLASVQAYSQKIEKYDPVWFLTLPDWGGDPTIAVGNDENKHARPEFGWTNFMIHAYVYGENMAKLQSYLDFPSRLGDLFYMQELVTTIAAPSAGGSSSPSPSPSPPPSPVPSPTPKPGDINGDGAVGLFDFSIMLTNWGSPDTSSDLNGDGIVGLFDFSLLLTYWGS